VVDAMSKVNISSSQDGERFGQLQASLRDRWRSIEAFDLSGCDILVVPSLSIDRRELLKIPGFIHYEELLLFALIRLQNPRNRIVYVTSQPLHPSIIDYYLQLLPGIPFSHARDRLLLFSAYDSDPKPLTQKILERPRLMARIRQALRPNQSFAICYNSTFLERDLSIQLDVPLFALDPELRNWGTKSGSRQIFAECGVPHPPGSDTVWSAEELADAAAELWAQQPGEKQFVVKLNQGFSGSGNALLDLSSLVDTSEISPRKRVTWIREQLPFLRFQNASETWENFATRIGELGAIIEVFVGGEVTRSPSVQGRITPNQEVEILSTHDQILGGLNNQTFLGCRFPADEAYRLRLQDLGWRIGRNLAEKGALERFAVDFLAVRRRDRPGRPYWDLQALEINLRKGGTTHPFMTLKFLTNGRYDLATGLFFSPQGRAKYYIASDNLQKDRYQGLLPNDLMDIIAYHQLHFDTSTETGTVFHLMGCLSEFGKLGLTSIGDSRLQAEEIHNKVIAVLDRETKPHTPATAESAYPSLSITWN